MSAKSLLLTLTGVAGAAALLVFVVTKPEVQTWAARRGIASVRGGISMGRLSAGLGQVSVEQLRVESSGAILVAPRVDARVGVLSAWLGNTYHFDSLVAKGWTLDLTRTAPPAKAGSVGAGSPWLARTAGAVLSAFEVPANLSLDGVDLEGDVIFPDETGMPAGTLHVEITGGGLVTGHQGRFLCKAYAKLSDPSAPVSSVTANVTLTAALEASGTVSRAELRGDAVASGQGFPSGVSLSVDMGILHGAGKKSYSVSLLRGSEQIGSVTAENPDGSTKISGSWQLDLRDTDIVPFALGRTLPAFHVAGSGFVDADGASGDVHATGKLQASADRLGAIAKGLTPLGMVGITADFDVAHLGPTLRVARLDIGLSGVKPVASVRALQSFEFNTASGELKVAVPTGDLVGISVAGVPLSWLRAAVPGFEVTGGDAHGEFVIRAEDGRLALRTRAPLSAASVALSRSGAELASGLECSAFVLADYAPQGWQVQLAPLAVRSEGVKMLSLEARFGKLYGPERAVKAAGSWSLSLPVLLSMKGASLFQRLSAGEASGSFEANLDTISQVEMKLAVRDLALPAGTPADLPSLDSEIHAEVDAAGRISFSFPLHLGYSGRTADLSLAGTVASDAKGVILDAALDGSRITRDDLAGIELFWGGGASGMGPGAAALPVPRRPWPPIRGKFALHLMEVSLPRVELRDLRGILYVDPSVVRIESGAAKLADGGAAKFDGMLSFNPAVPQPLSLSLDLSVDGVDSAPLFTAASPQRAPAIDGLFDIQTHLSGSGQRLGDVLENLQGDLRMTSKDGKFRALRADIIDTVKQAPSKLVDALDTVSSLFGKKNDKIGQALVESAKGLSEIHYDQMNILVERGSDKDLRLRDINMIAPEVRITGAGRVSYAPGVPIGDQALSVDLNLRVRGKVGKFLDIVGLLSEGQDELGYSKLTEPIHLAGSLRAVDQSQWKDMLVQASLRKGGGLFDKLLGR